MTNARDQVIEKINKAINSEHANLNFWVKQCTEKVSQLEATKRVLYLLPDSVLNLDWSVPNYVPHGANASLTFKGGDREYAILFDAGFEFPSKPQFNSGDQTFLRVGDLKVTDPLNGDIVIRATVGNIEKPPSCKVVEKKKRKTVIVFEAVCEETGEAL